MTMKIKLQSSRIPSFLEISQNMDRFQEGIQEKLKADLTRAIPKELRMISTDALEMSIQALSYGLQTQELQNAIYEFSLNHENPDKKSIDDLLNRLECIGCQISRCYDEQNRLSISIKKYLKKETEEEMNSDEIKIVTPTKIIKTIKEDDVEPQKDDFFYVDPSTNKDSEDLKDDAKSKQNFEMDNAQIQLTKKCFKPVLKELQEKIIPIDEEMKEREKKVLKEKGIEVVDELPAEKIIENDDSGSDDERERKIARSRSKFNASRQLLMSKKPFNIFEPSQPIPIKQRNGYKEDIFN